MNDDDGSALSVVDQSQRGMRIKSVGILTSSIIHIQSYLQFLQTEARLVIFVFLDKNYHLINI